MRETARLHTLKHCGRVCLAILTALATASHGAAGGGAAPVLWSTFDEWSIEDEIQLRILEREAMLFEDPDPLSNGVAIEMSFRMPESGVLPGAITERIHPLRWDPSAGKYTTELPAGEIIYEKISTRDASLPGAPWILEPAQKESLQKSLVEWRDFLRSEAEAVPARIESSNAELARVLTRRVFFELERGEIDTVYTTSQLVHSTETGGAATKKLLAIAVVQKKWGTIHMKTGLAEPSSQLLREYRTSETIGRLGSSNRSFLMEDVGRQLESGEAHSFSVTVLNRRNDADYKRYGLVAEVDSDESDCD